MPSKLHTVDQVYNNYAQSLESENTRWEVSSQLINKHYLVFIATQGMFHSRKYVEQTEALITKTI